MISRCELIKIEGLNTNERKNEIIPIMEHLLRQETKKESLNSEYLLDDKAKSYLVGQAWPFNVRTLEIFVEKLVEERTRFLNFDTGRFERITQGPDLKHCLLYTSDAADE